MTTPASGLQLSAEHPWPGLQSYNEAARDFFFGRGEETDALLRLVRRERLTVFYGQSGLGKTSLLQAALFPRLRETNLLPIPLRLDYAEGAPSLKTQVATTLAAAFRTHKIEARPPAPDEFLWAYFHRDDLDFWDARNQLVVPLLVLDQFEERFTLGRRNGKVDTEAGAFLTELSQLIENRPPPELRAQFDAHPETAHAYDFDKQTCKVILTLREDFLPELDGLLAWFPSLRDGRFRLRPMNKAQALDVVLKPGAQLVAADVAAAIVDFVAYSRHANPDGIVEPALLSLVLQELNSRRIQLGEAQISRDLLTGSKEQILFDFYERAVQDLPEKARLFLEDGLLTSSGYRDTVALEDARSEFGLEDSWLNTLVARRIIRLEERNGVVRIELVHDLLTGVIAESRRRRLDRVRWKQEQEKEWQSKNEKAIRLATRLNGTAEDWGRDQTANSLLLLKGAPLCQATEILEKHPDLLKPETGEWIIESNRTRRSRRVVWTIVAIVCALLIAYFEHSNMNADWVFDTVLSCVALITPCVLPVLDRMPRQVTRKTYAWSAWCWTFYSWFTYLILAHFCVISLPLSEAIGDTILVGAILLVPVFRWRTYIQVCRQSLNPPKRLPLSPKIALCLSAALLPALVVVARAKPELFARSRSITTDYETDYETNSAGWLEKTTTTLKTAGKVRETSYFQPASDNVYEHKFRTTYDKHGNIIEMAAFDAGGRPSSNSWMGVPLTKIAYDHKGRETNRTYHGADGLPVLARNGFAQTTANYDTQGNQIEWACFDTQGKPATDRTGVHLWRKKFAGTNWIEWENFGVAGKLTQPVGAYPKTTAKYDASGRQTEWACFDTNGHPTLDPNTGNHMARMSYDGGGRLTNWIFLGLQGRPVMTRNGYAEIKTQYDARGNQIKWACFDASGQPATDQSVGAHRWRKQFEGTNWTAWEYYGKDGKLAQPKEGLPKVTATYDARGLQIDWACFDTNGHPTIDLFSGCHLLQRAYDEHGRETNRVHYGTDGKPAASKDGYHRLATRYDSAGAKIGEAYFDLDGRQLQFRTALRVVQVLANGEADRIKLQVGDVIWAYDGWRLYPGQTWPDLKETSSSLVERIKRPGETPRELVVLRGGRPLKFEVRPGLLGMQFDSRPVPGSWIEANTPR